MTYDRTKFDFTRIENKERHIRASDDVGRYVATNVESWSQEQRAYALEIAREEGFCAEIVKGYQFKLCRADAISIQVPVGKSTGNFWKRLSEKYPSK